MIQRTKPRRKTAPPYQTPARKRSAHWAKKSGQQQRRALLEQRAKQDLDAAEQRIEIRFDLMDEHSAASLRALLDG